MELENIVANTVLLKAREGKLTHKGGNSETVSGSGMVTFCAQYGEKVGIMGIMTAGDSLQTERHSTAGKSYRCERKGFLRN